MNTLGPGLAVDKELRRPILANGVGGVSGPGIKPIALRCVRDVFEATGLPIIGTGGVITGEDAIEMLVTETGGNIFSATDVANIVKKAKDKARLETLSKNYVDWYFVVGAMILFLIEVLVRRVKEKIKKR